MTTHPRRPARPQAKQIDPATGRTLPARMTRDEQGRTLLVPIDEEEVPIEQARAAWLRMLIPQLQSGGFTRMAAEYGVELQRLEAQAHLAGPRDCNCLDRDDALAHLDFERKRDDAIAREVADGTMSRTLTTAERLREWSE